MQRHDPEFEITVTTRAGTATSSTNFTVSQ
jgi:hypothetical protein